MKNKKQPLPKSNTPPAGRTPVVRLARKRKSRTWLLVLLFILFAGALVSLGALAGYLSGAQAQVALQTQILELTLKEQYDLGVQDFEAGRYEVARQRFEYILEHDPSFPNVTENLAQVMSILYATATPTPPAPTASPTPTRDLRPAQELLAQAEALAASQDWDGAIDTLSSLRKEDSNFQTARVDGLLYICLRNRGVDKIWKQGNLEGGLYDLSLSERFGPLDVQANSARDLARLYIIGSSFWEVHPEQAVNYFSQVAAAAPGLRDASGWTANERYRAALIQYGDLLASQNEWCQAQVQYELAWAISPDATLQETIQNVALRCSPPSATPEMTTETPTPTATLPGQTATVTQGIPPSTATSTSTSVAPVTTATSTATPTATTQQPPNPTATGTPTPTATTQQPPEPTATETPTPTATTAAYPQGALVPQSPGKALATYWQNLSNDLSLGRWVILSTSRWVILSTSRWAALSSSRWINL